MKVIFAQRQHRKVPGFLLCIAMLILLCSISLPFITSSHADAAPIIISGPLPTGTVNTPYSTTLVASTPCTWALTGGILPPGLTLASNGTIYGIPTTANTYLFMASATDNASATAIGMFSITIVLPPLSIATSSLPQATEGQSYSASISVYNAVGSLTWVISGGSLPVGIAFDANSGYLWGTPVAGTAGTYSLTLTVTDNAATPRSVQRTFGLYVEKGYFRPTISIDQGLAAGSTKVYANGRLLTTLQGGESTQIAVDLGTTATITVDPIVNYPSKDNVRFKAETSSAGVSEGSLSAYFSYFTEYYITMKSAIQQTPVPVGTGWYRSGSSFATNAPETIEGGAGTQYRFVSWLLSNNNIITNRNISFTVTGPEIITAQYYTYYRLSVDSAYGETPSAGWYKSGSEAKWSIKNPEVPMKGILGFFKGKYVAVNPNGTEIMTGPKNTTITWENDYTLPFILIPLTMLALLGAIFALYYFVVRPRWKSKPVQQQVALSGQIPTPPQPQTTVVMINDTRPRTPMTTKEQLMEKFGELLEIYEKEIRESLGAPSVSVIAPAIESKQLPVSSFNSTKSAAFSAGDIPLCNNFAKKFIRTVVSPWQQSEMKTALLPESDKGRKKTEVGLTIVWAKSLYNEWQVSTCTLPQGHEGAHEGTKKLLYNLLNTVTEERTYGSNQPVTAPSPHFTDGMPEMPIDASLIVLADELTFETMR